MTRDSETCHGEVRVLPLVEWPPFILPSHFPRLGALMDARRIGVSASFDTLNWEAA